MAIIPELALISPTFSQHAVLHQALEVCKHHLHLSVSGVMVTTSIKTALIYWPGRGHNTTEGCRAISVTTHPSEILDWTLSTQTRLSAIYLQKKARHCLWLGNTLSKAGRHPSAGFIRLSPIYCGAGRAQWCFTTGRTLWAFSHLLPCWWPGFLFFYAGEIIF